MLHFGKLLQFFLTTFNPISSMSPVASLSPSPTPPPLFPSSSSSPNTSCAFRAFLNSRIVNIFAAALFTVGSVLSGPITAQTRPSNPVDSAGGVSIGAAAPDTTSPKKTGFPDWMDKVPPQGTGRNLKNGPIEPVDPDRNATIRLPTGPSEKSRFRFTPPTIPNLDAIKKKAIKTRYSQTKTGSNSEEINIEAFQTTNIDEERTRLNQLASAVEGLPDNRQKSFLQQALQTQQARIAAIEELRRLIPASINPIPQIDLAIPGQTQSASPPFDPDAPPIDAIFPGETGGNVDSAVLSSSPASLAGSSSSRPGQPTNTSGLSSPSEDQHSKQRIRQLLDFLSDPPPGMTSPAPILSSASIGALFPVPAAAPAPGKVLASAPAPLSITPAPSRIPSRFYRPEPVPSVFREDKENELETDQ
ncbi:MAG: hypothetical protein WA705_29890 [Candidatus Ozemobacteraceae bacterium]